MIDFLLDFRNPVTLGLVATIAFAGFSLLFFRLYILPITKKYLQLKEQIEIERLNRAAEEQKIRSRVFLNSEEKDKIKTTKEIHDTLLPLIYSSKFNIERYLSKENVENPLLKEAVEHLTQASTNIKNIIEELSPSNVEVLQLDLCLKKTINIFKNREGLNIELNQFSVPAKIKNKMATFICNAVSELLLNVKKHAEASRTEIDIYEEHNNIVVVVKDNGIGFDNSLYKEGGHKIGYGLSSIIEKANHFNGLCEVNSVINKGTEIKISLPL